MKVKSSGVWRYFNVILLFAVVILFILLIRSFENRFKPIPKEKPKIHYILVWNTFFGIADYEFGFGSKPFKDNKCPSTNCFMTDKRDLMPIDQFDAVVFHGPQYMDPDVKDRPSLRSQHQHYVYFSQESPANRKANQMLDDFFNLTATYRLDSDVLTSYFNMAEIGGEIIAPSCNVVWKEPTKDPAYLDKYMEIFRRKKKPVAWFASNCYSKNDRKKRVDELKRNISVDAYGACGTLSCPRSNSQKCFDLLKSDYFFYLSFENSNCKDYVTEKVLTGLNNEAVPVVYGGANYSRFLPPHSYIDATNLTMYELSNKLKYLMNNPKEYVEYFWWKDFYKIKKPLPFCELCYLLNKKKSEPYSYKIKEWWHGTKDKPMCQ